VGLLCDPGFGHDLIARDLLSAIRAGVRGEGAVAE
jgi:hypothetical protein